MSTKNCSEERERENKTPSLELLGNAKCQKRNGELSVSEPLREKKIGKRRKRPHCDFGAISCREPNAAVLYCLFWTLAERPLL